MPGRPRTTKKLARRINRDYFKRLYPMPRTRRFATLALTSLGVLWLVWFAFARNSSLYTAGPIRSSHAAFSNNCGACHVTQDSSFSRKVTDQACAACHDGPIHQTQQTFTPSCASCHMEHQGNVQLSRTSSQSCIQCHSDLKVKSGDIHVAAHVSSFTDGHPKFGIERVTATDPGTIKFNHKLHLKKHLRAPGGTVTLQCNDCHRPTGVNAAWNYGQIGPPAAGNVSGSGTIETTRHVSAAAYMAQINFYKHCSACHPLAFDKRFEAAPHKAPETVRAFALASFSTYIQDHPSEVRVASLARIAERPLPPLPRNAAEWVSLRMTEAEQLLWKKSCLECHALTYAVGSALPTVAAANLKSRWMENARFDHQPHQALQCESCHAKALDSEKTSEVLLPGIETCQKCHREGKQAAAEARCFECHGYHDWTKEKRIKGTYSIHQLISSLTIPAPGTSVQ